MRYHKVPDETVRRLPIYLRGLLSCANDLQENISSEQLGDVLGIHPWQIRKDFSYFGDFGTPGIGYNIEKLIKKSKKILKFNKINKVTVKGVSTLNSLRQRKINIGIVGVPLEATQGNSRYSY